MGLQQFEQRLERLVEGAFAKAFRGELQPIELGKRLTREMDLHRELSVRGVVAPNVFALTLSDDDRERFGHQVDGLSRDLASAARQHAHLENYKFLGPVEISIGWSDSIERGKYSIVAEILETEGAFLSWVVLPDGRRVGIGENPVTIGRVPESDIPIADPNVSRQHAELRRDGESVYIFDLDSTNGTRVNGASIRQHMLTNGEIITIGMTSLRFEAQ